MGKTKLDEGRRTEILAILGVGCSRRVAAMYVGCHVNTIRNTARRDPDFAERLARAENQAELAFLRRIHKAAEKEQYWRAAAWALERKNPAEYARKSPDVLTLDQVKLLLADLAEIVVCRVPVPLYRKQILKRLDALCAGLRRLARSEVGNDKN